jgi:hypothetical protein
MTSDTPVLLKTPDNRIWLKGPGIFQVGVYAVYAITPTIVLYCKERTHWKMLERFENALSPVSFTSEMVDHENSGHAGMSARFVFSSTNDFDFVKAFLKEIDSKPPPFAADEIGSDKPHNTICVVSFVRPPPMNVFLLNTSFLNR